MRFLGSLLLFIALPMAAFASDAGSKAIMQITKGKAKITKEFDAVNGLKGYVIKPVAGGRSLVVFSNKGGNYMFVGNIINKKGENLTQAYTEKYVNAELAKSALSDASKSVFFTDGSNSAPHKAYIIIDPNCIFCHKLYEELFPEIASGNVQVRWIPVGFLKPTSAGKAAALINAKDDATASKLLRADETHFNARHEEGGLKPLVKSDKGAEDAFAKVKTNTAFFSKYGFQGTPTLIYIDNHTHKAAYFPGFVGGERFKQLINRLGKTW